MNEPTRLRDEPHSELERSLLEAGRSYTASASTRRRALAALGVAGATASSTAAATTLTKAVLAKWALALAVVGGGALTAAHYLPRHRVNPSAPALAPSTVKALPVAPLPAATPEPAPEPASAVSANAIASSSSSAGAGAARGEPRSTSPGPLAAELSALDAARTSLSAGNPQAALTALDAYARSFPRGKLSLEAEVLRIDALAKSGQSAAARQRAEAFIKRHPDSVLAPRVRSSVGL